MLLLFAHGAGLGSTSPWMAAWAAHLGALGRVVRFDYPYMAAGRKRPDPLPTLIEAHREALDRSRRDGEPVVLIGKSMGSRVGCHLATAEAVDAVVCLGYPLIGATRARPVRDEVLLALRTPTLFVQGTRDPLCPLDRLAEVRRRMTTQNALIVVEGGDHSLVLRAGDRKARGTTQEQVDRALVARIGAWLARPQASA